MARRSSLRTPVKVEPARFLSIDEPTVCQDYERIIQKLNKQAEKHIRKRLDAERIDARRKKTTVSTRVNLINDGLYASNSNIDNQRKDTEEQSVEKESRCTRALKTELIFSRIALNGHCQRERSPH